MNLCRAHFEETRRLAAELDPIQLAAWLLRHGYYPEQYVLPPCFEVQEFELRKTPYYKVRKQKNRNVFVPERAELEAIEFPRSRLTVRGFGVIEPRIYHDLVWYLCHEWPAVVDHLFSPETNIYSYSFPIPVTTKQPGKLGQLRAGRMIYEFIEMAENDLVGEAHKYHYILKTDVTNCYPSIYTHSVAWALHGRQAAQDDRYQFQLLGNKIDKLLQNSNDGRTNGIAIGPAICDLVAELLLAAVDRRCTTLIKVQNIEFLGVRFKDDYRFLCASEEDARRIAKALQRSLREFNLTLSEGKSEVLRLPEGLFRQWRSAYHHWSKRYALTIPYKQFEATLLAVLRIDSELPGTGIIDSFLSELTTRKFRIKLSLSERQARKAYSLLLLLRERRAKSFPSILAVTEAIITKYEEYGEFRAYVQDSLLAMLELASKGAEGDEYDTVWILYFLRTVLGCAEGGVREGPSKLLRSLIEGEQRFFCEEQAISLFRRVRSPPPENHLLRHLAVFHRRDEED